MDEILHSPSQRPEKARQRTHGRKQPATFTKERFSVAVDHVLDGAVLTRRTLRRISDILDETLGRVRFNPILFLAMAALLSVVLVVSTVYTPAFVVRLDGERLGLVADMTEVEAVVDRVEARASRVLGYDYTLTSAVTYEQALTRREELVDAKSFETTLFGSVNEIMNSYVLRVGGEIIGSWTDEAELQAMLDSITAPYTTENTTSAGFVEPVTISYELIPSDSLEDLNAMLAMLTENTTGETTYEVVKGDTYSAIAFNNDMSLDELMALNPEASINRLMIGDIVNVKEIIPFLSVQTTENVTYTAEIACPVEQVEDSSMYKGDSKVITYGVPGEALINADVSYVNGMEKERTILSEEILSEPTTQVVAVGTKERPRTLPTGTLIWPTSGRITSYYGNRYIFGSYSFHRGIDISNSYGSSIVASDGGTVTYAGYNGTYGNIIVISHGNGVETAYAHCSSMLVSVGSQVYQGQLIGRTGRTGRATGNHLHFEVRINGSTANPLSYLP